MDWVISSTEAEGHFGGTLTTSIATVRIISTNRYGSIMGKYIEDSESRKHFFILNLYGPFYDRKDFWDNKSGALDILDLILGGNFNLTLSSKKTWGKDARGDSL